MKFYFLPISMLKKIPYGTYKDKILLMSRIDNTNPKKLPNYNLILDYTTVNINPIKFTSFILYKLDPEDFTHLNLIGIDINPKKGIKNARLLEALEHNILTVDFHVLYT